MSSRTVAVIGTGTMGGAAVRALHAAGTAVRAFDIRPTALAELPTGVHLAESATDAASTADLMLLSLPMPSDVRDVAEELASDPRAGGGMVVDLSTIDPGTARAAGEGLAAAGIDYVDAPVLGRPAGVGGWTLVAGGRESDVERAQAVLEGSIAARVVRVGGIGSGSIVKLMNNLMFGAINAVTGEVLTVCAAAGLDPGVFVDVVVGSGAASVSGLFRDIGPRIVDGEFDPTFMVSLLHKDNRLAVQLADSVNVPLFAGRGVDALNTLALSRFGDLDSSAVIKVIEEATGVSARRCI